MIFIEKIIVLIVSLSMIMTMAVSSTHITVTNLKPSEFKEYNSVFVIAEKLKEKQEQQKVEEIQSNQKVKEVNNQPSRNNVEVNKNNEQVVLLARLIQSEALGESYEGKVAVGEVVVNRTKNGSKTLKEVIYAPHQFSGVGGKLFKREPNKECIKAAQEVLDGSSTVNGSQYFVNLNIAKPSWTNKFTLVKRIGNHWFYKK